MFSKGSTNLPLIGFFLTYFGDIYGAFLELIFSELRSFGGKKKPSGWVKKKKKSASMAYRQKKKSTVILHIRIIILRP